MAEDLILTDSVAEFAAKTNLMVDFPTVSRAILLIRQKGIYILVRRLFSAHWAASAERTILSYRLTLFPDWSRRSFWLQMSPRNLPESAGSQEPSA